MLTLMLVLNVVVHEVVLGLVEMELVVAFVVDFMVIVVVMAEGLFDVVPGMDGTPDH